MTLSGSSQELVAALSGVNAHIEASVDCKGIKDNIKVEVTDFGLTVGVTIDGTLSPQTGGFVPTISITQWTANLDGIKLNFFNDLIEPFLLGCAPGNDLDASYATLPAVMGTEE